MTNHKSFNLFTDIKNPELRAYNRLAMAFNIGKDHSTKAMAEYASKIPEHERHEFNAIAARIAEHGREKVKAEIMRTNREVN